MGGSLTEAAALAKQECEKVGKVAEFNQVRKEATPSSRVAQFVCVEPKAGAEAPSSDVGSP